MNPLSRHASGWFVCLPRSGENWPTWQRPPPPKTGRPPSPCVALFHVGDRRRNHSKPGNEIVVGIKLDEMRMNRAGSQVQQVEDDESRNDRTAPHHRPRCVTGLDAPPLDIRDRPGFVFQQGKLDRSPDVQHDGNEKDRPRGPQQTGIPVQRLRIMIHYRPPQENLKISEHVRD